MSEIIRVIDLSEFTGPIAPANARCMVEDWNIQGVILQAWGAGNIPGRRNEHFHQAVDVFRKAGITRIDPYVWPPRQWREAIDWIGDYKRFMSGSLYLDVEAGAGVDDAMVNGVREAGWEPRIYASPASWRTIMGNTDKYSDLKLWLARYLLRFRRVDGFYTPGFDLGALEFPQDAMGNSQVGGWILEDLVGWQITGTVPDFCGESIDSGLFHASAFKEGNMETDEYKELKAQIEGVTKVLADLKKVQADATDLIGRLEELSHSSQDDLDTGAVNLAEHEANPDAHHA